MSALEDLRVEIKTVPDMSDIISGKAKISELRTVSAEDLLGRDPVAPDPELLAKNTTGRAVMVSGAGGSIGSELCRQILAQNPTILVLYDVSEFALYAIEGELSDTVMRLKHQTRVVPILGSVQNSRRLEAAIKAFHVQTIYHAAAYKHVPLVEENVVEGIRNNVFGTLTITLAAQKFGVENFILVSTDKAVRPTNVIAVCVTGLRKGEKLYEELLIGSNPAPTKHPIIMTASEVPLPRDALIAALDRLHQACDAFDLPTIVAILHELPLEYAPLSAEIADLLWGGDQDREEPPNMAIEGSVRE